MIHYVLFFHGFAIDVSRDTFFLALNVLSQEYDVQHFHGYNLAGNNVTHYTTKEFSVGQIIYVDGVSNKEFYNAEIEF